MASSQFLWGVALLVALMALILGPGYRAQAMGGGPYQLERHSNATADAGVFRLDTSSGEVSYCYVSGTAPRGRVEVLCTQPVR